jgi:hypothetical protein
MGLERLILLPIFYSYDGMHSHGGPWERATSLYIFRRQDSVAV